MLAGKGVTYDTGGADLKTDGHMAGMSRDKGGAGAVAGLLRAMAELEIPGVRVIGLLGMVRNSIGDEAFVERRDHPLRAGVRVRIGNTDAEGPPGARRSARRRAGDRGRRRRPVAALGRDAHRATPTGPMGLTSGASATVRRAPGATSTRLDAHGEQWGEPFERSRPRREDYAFVAPAVVGRGRRVGEPARVGEHAARAPVPLRVPRHGLGAPRGALPFMHLDIAGLAVDPPDWQFGRPTGAPVATLASWIASFSR